MAEKREFQAIKGTRDLLPPETELWNRVEQTAREVFGTFGFGEIRLPIFEPTELFARSIGLDTEIVAKEMYSFPDPFDLGDMYAQYQLLEGRIPGAGQFASVANLLPDSQLIAARPEATASVCRAYIEHGMHALTQPVKLYYMGPMFRRERPQKGRFRQFYQIGAEAIGSDSPIVDAEVIEMVVEVLRRSGLEGFELLINSIGDSNCRPAYLELLKENLQAIAPQLCEDCQRRVVTNPLRVLD